MSKPSRRLSPRQGKWNEGPFFVAVAALAAQLEAKGDFGALDPLFEREKVPTNALREIRKGPLTFLEECCLLALLQIQPTEPGHSSRRAAMDSAMDWDNTRQAEGSG